MNLKPHDQAALPSDLVCLFLAISFLMYLLQIDFNLFFITQCEHSFTIFN